MRAKKNFIVVAYDVSDDGRRNKIVKVLEKNGTRVNYSVFECLLTDLQFDKLKQNIELLIKAKEDSVVYYFICVNCFTKIVYQPSLRKKYDKVSMV